MNRNIPAQVSYDRTNKGVDVRNSSTANFLIDSQDRPGFNATTIASTEALANKAADFTITKLGQNLVTGFFTRFAMTEIELEWNVFNVNTNNNTTGVTLVNTSTNAITNFPSISIPIGNYTVQTALDALVASMNLNVTPQNLFSVVNSVGTLLGAAGKKAIQTAGPWKFAFYRPQGTPLAGPMTPNLAQNLGCIVWDATSLPLDPALALTFKTAQTAYSPNLLAYNYIDITCPQLSSQQKVKDATTSTFDAIDVVYRWVFANDEADPSVVDSYGYPILQGYLPFKSRRYLGFPKQIRWDPLLPIGNLQFQVYTDQEVLLQYQGILEKFEFKMLMLLSEV
jgi:hypothetical protein